MRRKLIRVSVAALVAIAFIGFSTAAAQERRALGNYPMSRINVPGTSNYLGIMDWTITKKKSSVVFAWEYDSDTGIEKLVKFNLSQNGNASGYTTLLNTEGWIIDAEAVWIGQSGASVGPAAKEKKTGLLFVVHTPTDSEETIIISVARFNDKGNLLGGFRQLRQFNVPEDKYYYFGVLSAALGSSTVGVSWTYSLYEVIAGTGFYVTSNAYFLETDFQGRQIGGMSQVPIPNGGNNQFFILHRPYWNGKGWLAPARNARTAPSGGSFNVLGNDLYILTATSGRVNPKLRLRLLFRDGQDDLWTYRASFVPPSSGGSAGAPKVREARAAKTSTLFLSHWNLIPEAQQTMDEYAADYFLVQINRKGKKVGSATRVQIPEWDHGMPYDPGKELIRFYDRVSNVITTGDGTCYVAQARTTLLREQVALPPASYVYDAEHEYSLYSFDPQSGEVDIIARGASGETGYFSTTRIRWFNGNIAVINRFLDVELPYDDRDYFSKFRP